MKEKQGFTLIELLAVIIILAVIALIATPLVLNIIEKAEKGAFKDSVYGIMEATEFQVILDNSKYPITYVFPEDNNKIQFKGSKPAEGYIQVVNEGKIKLALGNGRWCAEKGVNESQVTIRNGKCDKIDLNLPILSGYGNLTQEVNVNETYILPNVTATDKDGNQLNVTTIIKQGDQVVDSIDTSKASTYTITYTTEPDKNGNTSTISVTITILKKETLSDQIIESGTNDGTLELIDNTYYYQGENPKNYIRFNNELWRILSIENGKMKLIRNTSIENIAWNNSNKNDWPTSDIHNYLNSEYLQTLKEVQNLIEEGLFYTGTFSWNINATAIQIKESDKSSTWTGYIGLMNASDYLYTSKDSSCTTRAINNSNCKNSNWLYTSEDQWTINTWNVNSNGILIIASGGYLAGAGTYNGNNYTYYLRNARPVIFLKQNVKIVTGEGTETDPFQIN